MSDMAERLIRAASEIAQPEVVRVLVTTVIPEERGCLKLPRKRWLLVPAALWHKIEGEIPRVEHVDWPRSMLFGLPIEHVPPNTDREREIIFAIIAEVDASLTATSGGA